MDEQAPITPQASPPEQTHRKLSKQQMTLFMSLGVAGLLAIIGMVVYMLFFSISKEDYRHAEAQTNAVILAYNNLSVATSTLAHNASDRSVKDDEYASSQAKYLAAYNKYQDEVSQLNDEPALQNGTVMTAYDSFAQKNSDFMTSLKTNNDTATYVRKATIACGVNSAGEVDAKDLSKIVSAYDTVITPCKEAMTDLEQADDTTAQSVAQKATAYIAQIRGHLEAMQTAYTSGNRKAFEAEYNTYLNLASEFGKNTDTTHILQQQSIATPEKELNQLALIIKARE